VFDQSYEVTADWHKPIPVPPVVIFVDILIGMKNACCFTRKFVED